MIRRFSLLFLLFLSIYSYAQEDIKNPTAKTSPPTAAPNNKPTNNGNVSKPISIALPSSKVITKVTNGSKKTIKTKTPQEIALNFYEQGNAEKRARKYENALKSYSSALENDSNFVEAFLGLASTQFLMINFDGALVDYDKAIKLGENLQKKFKTKANIKRILEDPRGAKIEADKANYLNPILAEAYYQRGNVKHFIEDGSSCDDLKKAKKLGYLKVNKDLEEYCK